MSLHIVRNSTNKPLGAIEWDSRERDPIYKQRKICFPFPHGIPRIPFDREIFFWFWVKLVSETMMRWQMNGANQCRTGYIFNHILKCTYSHTIWWLGPAAAAATANNKKKWKMKEEISPCSKLLGGSMPILRNTEFHPNIQDSRLNNNAPFINFVQSLRCLYKSISYWMSTNTTCSHSHTQPHIAKWKCKSKIENRFLHFNFRWECNVHHGLVHSTCSQCGAAHLTLLWSTSSSSHAVSCTFFLLFRFFHHLHLLLLFLFLLILVSFFCCCSNLPLLSLFHSPHHSFVSSQEQINFMLSSTAICAK